MPTICNTHGSVLRHLILRNPFACSVEWPRNLTTALLTRPLAELAQLSLTTGDGETKPLEHYFEIQEIQQEEQKEEAESADFPAPLPAVIQLTGDLSHVHGIGRGWSQGQLIIEGTTGDCVGEGMTGGSLLIQGDTGHFAGRGMSGGVLKIFGNTRDSLGGPLPGKLKGMTGGEILIHGSTGDQPGYRMRRGTIVISKGVGQRAGRDMLAGTILLLGPLSEMAELKQTGQGMKRGTIVLMNPENAPAAPLAEPVGQSVSFSHFDYACRYEPVFMRVLLKYLQQTEDWPATETLLNSSYHRYSGDMLQGGRGELLLRVDPNQ